jgi:hypothetical protein
LEKRRGRGATCRRTQYRRFGRQINRRKNRETGVPLALDGRRLMGGHNNQPKVGVNDGRGVGEETLPGRIRTCVGVLSLRSGQQIEREKKSKIKYVVALGGAGQQNHTTTNQKHVGATKEGMETMSESGGARRGRTRALFRGRLSWEKVKIK